MGVKKLASSERKGKGSQEKRDDAPTKETEKRLK
jgi:hypothetical protein